MIKKEQDPMGQAMYHYFHYNDTTSIKVNTNITEGEELPVPYLFRDYSEMPFLEKEALRLVKGKVLDVGAGSGTHSIYLQNNGFDVTSIDISELSCELMIEQGLKNVICSDIWLLEPKLYDTILLIMNGIGLVKNLQGLEFFLDHIKQFVRKKGQILFDSTDIKYVYNDFNDNLFLDSNPHYYGELEYHLKYKKYVAEPFPWLYIDFDRLTCVAKKLGWNVKLIYEDDHFHYLVKLTLE